MHIHILGICGTFMGGLALLAKQRGFTVTGSDANVYPPMSTQLQQQGIRLIEGFDVSQLEPVPDCIIVGNAMKRGNPCIEYILNKGLRMYSGPQWLAEFILPEQWVLAVAGTHGKSTTASLLAWILEYAGLDPSFLIGAVAKNFGISARLGKTPFFVIEADEYDSAFFDKRSKFIHYRPRTVILNILEYDHADIFPDLAAIQTQFHHLVRTIPEQGLIVKPQQDKALQQVLEKGCWTPIETFDLNHGNWVARDMNADGSHFTVYNEQEKIAEVKWQLTGRYNVLNALAAIAAARHVGVFPAAACEALEHFKGVKRRLDVIAEINHITVYDDFAHHPTAIKETLLGLRHRVGQARILAILDFASYTMRVGQHGTTVAAALQPADFSFLKQPTECEWDIKALETNMPGKAKVINDTQQIIDNVITMAKPSDHIIIMSNKGFDNIHTRLVEALNKANKHFLVN